MAYIEAVAYEARSKKIKALEAENARLREALEKLLDNFEASLGVLGAFHDDRKAIEEARAALKESDDAKEGKDTDGLR